MASFEQLSPKIAFSHLKWSSSNNFHQNLSPLIKLLQENVIFRQLPPKNAILSQFPPKNGTLSQFPPKNGIFKKFSPKVAIFEPFPPKVAIFEPLPPKVELLTYPLAYKYPSSPIHQTHTKKRARKQEQKKRELKSDYSSLSSSLPSKYLLKSAFNPFKFKTSPKYFFQPS